MGKSNKKKPARRKIEKGSTQKRSTAGKNTSEIVKRHLSDKNDRITGEDFKTLKIDLSVPKDKAHRPLPIKANKERPKDADKDNTILTPWDVISE